MAREALEKQLDELATELERVGETRWSAWARQTATRVNEGSAGSRDVREAFGGMGSLNDLIIHPANGHRVDEAAIDVVNASLSALRASLYELAQLQ